LVLKLFNIAGFNDNPSETEINTNVSSSKNDIWSILEYLEMGWVKQVDLYDNSRSAIVQASSPELGNRPPIE
jgi:hypothetical protein